MELVMLILASLNVVGMVTLAVVMWRLHGRLTKQADAHAQTQEAHAAQRHAEALKQIQETTKEAADKLTAQIQNESATTQAAVKAASAENIAATNAAADRLDATLREPLF